MQAGKKTNADDVDEESEEANAVSLYYNSNCTFYISYHV